ncbi:MAG: M20 family metallo-hydrolase [Ferruginibacter sp.]
MNDSIKILQQDAIGLLKELIAIPSFSKEEDKTADAIENFLKTRDVITNRHLNNIWAVNKYFDAAKQTVLLNSHHDTVKPNPQYTKDPFDPVVEDGKLFGLGSNDAGGCLVSLIAAFLYFHDKKDLKFNIVIAATAEEEISGFNGIESLLQNEHFTNITAGYFAASPSGVGGGIVGEPTLMNLAVAEKGLLVLDCISHGKAGHAAREEGDNAIYKALKDIEWFRTFSFPKISATLGAVKMSITVINTENKQHNVVPAVCNFVADIRVTDEYTHEEIISIVKQNVSCEVKPRSLRMRSTKIDMSHPIVQSAISLGKTAYGSPTCSDKALMPFPALKCGPGDSARSHTADEFIYLREIEEGISTYIQILQGIT